MLGWFICLYIYKYSQYLEFVFLFSANSVSSPSESIGSSLASPIEINPRLVNKNFNAHKKLKNNSTGDYSKHHKRQRNSDINSPRHSSSNKHGSEVDLDKAAPNSDVSASNISLGVSTLKRLFPNAKSSYLEKVLYTCNGDLVFASQTLSSEQQNPNNHQQQQQQHLLSLANTSASLPPQSINTSYPFNNTSYQSGLMSSLNSNTHNNSQSGSSPASFNQYHQHFNSGPHQTFSNLNQTNLSQQSHQFASNSSPFLNKPSAFSPMFNPMNGSHNQHLMQEQAVVAAAAAAMQLNSNFAALAANSASSSGSSSAPSPTPQHFSPFAAYSRMHAQAMAAHGSNNAVNANVGNEMYNPFNQFPYFNLSSAAQQFAVAAAAASLPKSSSNSMSHKVASLIMNTSVGSTSTSSENLSNSLSFESNSSQHVANISSSSSAASSSSSSPSSNRKLNPKSPASFNSPNSASTTTPPPPNSYSSSSSSSSSLSSSVLSNTMDNNFSSDLAKSPQ